MQPQQEFETLLRLDTAAQRDKLGRLAARYPMEFRTWAVAWISGGGHGPGARLVLRLLHQKNLLVRVLVNPGAMPLRDAIRIARIAQHAIANFDWIVADTIRDGTETQVARVLQVLQHLNLSSRIVPGLAAALRNRNAKIRSLVSRLLGRLCDDPSAIRALFEDRDSRVRANAIEGLWGSGHAVARDLLRVFIRDPDNRVAANAALGLAKLGDPGGAEALRKMSSHPDPRHRISAAWCIGQTADRALSAVLEQLAEDRVAKVRDSARAALGRMQNAGQGSANMTVHISHAYRTTEGGVRLRAFVSDSERNPVDLSADCFRAFRADEPLPRRELRQPAWRDVLMTILWLADCDLSRGVQDKAREGILAAMHTKRPDDLYCVVGCAVKSTLSPSSDLSQLADSLKSGSGQEQAAGSPLLFHALTLAGSRPGCRTVIAFASGPPFQDPAHLELLIRRAAQSEIAVHAVVFANNEVERAWSRIAAETQGSYHMVDDEKDLPETFWNVFSEVSSAYEITYGPPAGSSAGTEADFRLDVRSATGFGQARFQPLLLEGGM